MLLNHPFMVKYPSRIPHNPKESNPAIESKNTCHMDTYGDGSKPWYLVNPKIAGKWMFIPLKMVSIGIDPYPYPKDQTSSNHPWVFNQ